MPTPALSNALPLPTSMKSFWQACDMTWPTLKSLASSLSTTILRPLMPPAALHHLLNPSAVSKNSCSRPGAAAAPGSAVTPMWISVSVTPRAVAPDALPEPQTAFSEPKSPGAALGAADVDVLEAGALLVPVPVGVLLERPQADTPSATAMTTAEPVAKALTGLGARRWTMIICSPYRMIRSVCIYHT